MKAELFVYMYIIYVLRIKIELFSKLLECFFLCFFDVFVQFFSIFVVIKSSFASVQVCEINLLKASSK